MGQNLSEGLGQISESFSKLGGAMQLHQMTKDIPGGPFMDPEVAKLAIMMASAKAKGHLPTEAVNNYEYYNGLLAQDQAKAAAFRSFVPQHVPKGGGGGTGHHTLNLPIGSATPAPAVPAGVEDNTTDLHL